MRIYYMRRLLFFMILILFSRIASSQFIKDTYRFNNNLSVSPPDCGPDLIPTIAPGNCNPVFGSGGFFQNETIPYCAIGRPVYHNNMNWGLKYPNTAGTITTTYTIHIYLKNTNWGTHPWVRIIDFSDGLSDAGIYYKNEGAPDRCLEFFPVGLVGPCPYFNNTTWYLLTFTRDGATGMMYVYVNNALFGSYNDAMGRYTSAPGKPVYIYRDDQLVPCEAGEASFAYLSFTNRFSTQSIVDSVYNDICSITNATISSNFTINPYPACQSQIATVNYAGDIPSPGTGYSFNWTWNNATVISGSGMGPYSVSWSTPGLQTISLTVINNTCLSQNADTVQIQVSPPLFSTVSRIICEGDSIEGYTASGTYIDTLTSMAGCDSIRTLNLVVKPKATSAITQTICEGQSFAGYTASGIYHDTFPAANGCDSIRTLALTVIPRVRSAINQSICEGQTFLGYSLTGIYHDTLAAANGCDSIRTLNLTVVQKPTPDLGIDKELCTGDSLLLTPGNYSSYLWQDGSSSEYFVAKQPGIYSVTVTETCGSASDNILITTKDCTPYFPNAFTPNNDGKNDLFKVLNTFDLQNYLLVVYNRWGQKVFETKDPAMGWDGKLKGRIQDGAVFVWYSKFKHNNKDISLKGTVFLIR